MRCAQERNSGMARESECSGIVNRNVVDGEAAAGLLDEGKTHD
ncbi:MAG: hypothetical protein ACI9W2_002285 [Gammaproteobacteria bacterium]|jgi:hypothetical protein